MPQSFTSIAEIQSPEQKYMMYESRTNVNFNLPNIKETVFLTVKTCQMRAKYMDMRNFMVGPVWLLPVCQITLTVNVPENVSLSTFSKPP